MPTYAWHTCSVFKNLSNNAFSIRQVIPSDSSDRQNWNSNNLGSERDPAVGCFGEDAVGKREAQEKGSLVSLLNENGAMTLDSR